MNRATRRPARAARPGVPVLLAAIVLLTACKVGPDYEAPETTVPDLWQQSAARGVATGEAQLQTWWQVLEDPLLADLIRRAELANLDLRQALGRIREARALVRVASGQKWPDLDVAAEAGRSQSSDNGAVPAPAGGFDAASLYTAGFDAVWELDFFGRVRRSVEAASAGYQASIEDYRDVMVTLFAEVARNYVNLRTLERRLFYAHANVEIQRETLQLTTDRFNAGLVSALDIAQAESNLASSESAIPTLEAGAIAATFRLAVLLGEHPGSLDDELGTAAAIPEPAAAITVGLPGELLRQRPDVRRAERDLAEQTARIGIAVADLYPRFSLTGFLGLQSTQIGDFGSGDSVTWSIGLPVSWNVFDRGRTRGAIDAEKARTEQLLSFYQNTVLLALEEVENSLVSYDRLQLRRDKLLEAVDATVRSLDLVRTQYMAGLTDFQNVLDTQRSLSSQQDQLADAEGQVIQSLIAIYKALGGGWAEDFERPETLTAGAATATDTADADSSP